MQTKLNEAAQALMDAARRMAEHRQDKGITGTHILLAALRSPFPSLTAAFRSSNLKMSIGKVADQWVELLESVDLDNSDAKLFDDVLAEFCVTEDHEANPEMLVKAAFNQQDPGTAELIYLINQLDRKLVEQFSTPRPLGANADLSKPVELKSDKLGPSVAILLNQAQILAHDRKVNTRLLIQVCVSDVSSFLSKGLLAVGGYDKVIRSVGGKLRLTTNKRMECEIDCCTELLQTILQQALAMAVGEGRMVVSEQDLVLALIADALHSGSQDELAAVGMDGLRELEAWAQAQRYDTENVAAVGEVPIDKILDFFQSRLLNQDQAIEEVYRPILRVRLGLGFEDALAAVLLFVGPPGVGKSYLAKLMAQVLYGYDPNNPEAHFVMIECGRYKDSHAVTDLIGAPHGYIGSDKGILRDGVRDKYPCVIVFDEAERMHKGIWDALLTLLNDGVFRDNEGQRYTLKDCVVVLTSNKGIEDAENYRKNKIFGEHDKADALVDEAKVKLEGSKPSATKAGPREVLSADEFWSNDEYRENYKTILLSQVREHFGAALYSRIDEKIGFNGLRIVDYISIADIAIKQLTAHLEAKTGVKLWYAPSVPDAIASEARNQLEASARDINRFVRKYILDDAFSQLKLKELKENIPLAHAYQIKARMKGKGANQVLDKIELVPEEPTCQPLNEHQRATAT